MTGLAPSEARALTLGEVRAWGAAIERDNRRARRRGPR